MQEVEQATGDNKSCQVEYLETPVKSENDKKEYRAIRLPNGLEVLLISDEYSKVSEHQDMKNEMKAAGCLCLRTGIFKDSPEFPGISFFFEHILYTEFQKHCEKYLEKLTYKHGGTCNCLLDHECISFIFDIQEKRFLSALIHFAGFFTNPLPEKDAFMQNRDNIKEEFRTALNFAKERVHEPQLSSFTRTEHPINKISENHIIKVLENLDYTKLYEELHKFTERHYSARKIKLVIQARLPLNTLEQYVTIYTSFVNIPTNELSPDESTELKNDVPFDTTTFRKMYKVTHSKHSTQLEVTWAVPSLPHLYKSKPYRYISSLIGHEGKGSLISYLRKEMWNITPSYDGICQSTHTFTYSLFKIIIDLSNEGKRHVMEVLEAIFSYINLLKKEGPQKRIYDEFSKSSEIDFSDSHEEHPVDNVRNLCINLHRFPSRDYITGSMLYFKYDPEAITKILDYLTPETVNIMIFGKDFDSLELDKIDLWSKALYTDIEISQKWIKHWKTIKPLPDFHLPLKNVCHNLECSLESLPAKVPKYPVKLYSDSISELWYRPNPKFRLPKSYMYIHLISPLGLQSPENAALMTVYCNIIKLLVIEELYPATEVGYNYDINVSGKGIIIKISGPMPLLLLLTIITCMKNCSNQITKRMFEVIRDEQIDIYNGTFTKPEELAKDVRLWILKLVHYTYIDMHNALKKISFEDFQNFAKSFTNRLYIQFLAQGNMSQDAAIETMRQCVESFKCDSLHSSMMEPNRVFQIPLGTSYCKLKNVDKLDPTSVVINTYQVDATSSEFSVLISLMILIMRDLLLTYRFEDFIQHASCDCVDVDGILEYSITVKSVTDKLNTTKRIEQCIDGFLTHFKGFLEVFSENDFEYVKEQLRVSLQHVDMNVSEEINRNWNEIMKCQYMFDRHESEIPVLNKIKINEIKECFEKYTWNKNYMKKLSVHVIGTDLDKVQPIALEYIVDEHQYKNIKKNYIIKVEEYKKKLYVYPVTEG